MSLLHGLHGTVAAILICSLLFVDEAGLPLPVAPNEVLLLLTGVLIASDAFPLWAIAPAVFAALLLGMIAGYFWARTLGQSGLQSLAERVRARDAYDRAQARLKSATPWGIGVARMIPGLRPYATLVSGAAEVDMRTFLLGAVPALLVWEFVWVLVGIVAGLPIAHLLHRVEQVALRGGILLVLAAVGWFATRRPSADHRNGIASLAPRLRAFLALVVDAVIVLSVVGGLFDLVERMMQISASGWIEIIVAAASLTAFLLLGRVIQTPGEMLFDTTYWHHTPAEVG